MNESPDLGLLETFYQVAHTGSVAAAARALHRSQPAVSHRLRALREQLGVPLFERIGRRLALTDHGRKLRDLAVDLLARARGVREAVVGEAAGVEGRVAIGTLPTVTAHLLVPVVAGLLARHPGVELTFVFDYVPALCERLRAGELGAVIAIGEATTTGLDAEPLGSVGLVAVMARSGAPARGSTVRPAELRRRRLLAWGGPSDPTFDRALVFAQRHGLIQPATPRIPHVETLRELAAAGAGYAILPGYTVLRDVKRGRVSAFPLPGLRSPVTLLTRTSQVRTRAAAAVLDALRALRAELRAVDRGLAGAGAGDR